MNEKETGLSEKAEAAFQQTAATVVRQAKQTGTPLVVWENGHVTEIPSADIEDEIHHQPAKPASH
jgi:hypothetical protein